MFPSHAATRNGMTVLKVCELYNLLRSTDAAAVEKHFLLPILSKGHYRVVTIVFSNLCFDFLFSLFLVYTVQIPHRP